VIRSGYNPLHPTRETVPVNLEVNLGKLDGKVAIVTGAARGLGRAYAKRLAGLGAKVAVADLNLRSYEEFEAEAKDMTADSTVAEIEASGGTALGIEVDVRDHEAVEAMVARVVKSSSGAGLMCSSRMRAAVVVDRWIPRPATSIRLCCTLSSR
jgi:NAD(P)-dependent dehydrogenase (short-subunit alcohol dehydrogenase family)